jgi:hypothetical protein
VRLLIRTLQRLAIFAIGLVSIWLIVFVVYDFADRRLPWMLALGATYAIGAYAILPYAVRMGLKVLQRRHVPRFTVTGDGLPGDPVNIALIGTEAELRSAFAAAGWTEADPLTLRTAWHMARAFALDLSYPAAPFSTLYLFGRGQDFGFQLPIDGSPRKRHHVRFWAKDVAEAEANVNSADFWLNTDTPDPTRRVLWIGAGTKDTGFGLTSLTFQITHATDFDTNAEREFIIAALEQVGAVIEVARFDAGDRLSAEKVNHYISDGNVAVATLAAPRA